MSEESAGERPPVTTVILPHERCSMCLYFGFNGLKKWCLHPANNRPIKDHMKKCRHWWDRYIKEKAPVPRIPIEDLPKEAP